MRSRAEEIYEAALALNEAKLSWLSSITSIDEWFPGKYLVTAICKLAQQHPPNQKAIELLLQCGANINHAVYGAAIGENWELMKTLLNRGASHAMAAKGACQAKTHEWKRMFESNNVKPIHFLEGTLLAGNTENVFQLLERNPQLQKCDTLVLASVYTQKIGQLIQIKQKYGYSIEESEEYEMFAFSFIHAENAQWLKNYRASKKEEFDKRRYSNEIKLKKINLLYTKMLSGIAFGGAYENLIAFLEDLEMEEYTEQKALFEELINLLFYAGHGEMALQLSNTYKLKLLPRYQTVLIQAAIHGYQYNLLETIGAKKQCDLTYFSEAASVVSTRSPKQAKRFNTIAQDMCKHNLTATQVLIKRNPQFFGALSLLTSLKRTEKSPWLRIAENDIPPEIWLHVLSFLSPLDTASNQTDQLEELGLFMNRQLNKKKSANYCLLL